MCVGQICIHIQSLLVSTTCSLLMFNFDRSFSLVSAFLLCGYFVGLLLFYSCLFSKSNFIETSRQRRVLEVLVCTCPSHTYCLLPCHGRCALPFNLNLIICGVCAALERKIGIEVGRALSSF